MDKPLDKAELLRQTQSIGPEIMDLKGYTSAGVSLATCRLIGAIIRDERCVIPVSTCMDGKYGYDDVAMSLPCVVGKAGISHILELPLDEDGKRDLTHCHDHLRQLIDSIEA